MKEILGLHHIALHTKDSERSIAFYKVFGAEIIDHTVTYIANRPGHFWKLTLLQVADFVLELKEPSCPDEMQLSDNGYFNHICLKVSDVEQSVASLKEKGVNSFIAPEIRQHSIYSPRGIKNAFLRGPDGEQIELVEYK
jgi:catechol 2,3-dioxygenase-like lactoylglutathione lyase family enzyme